MRVNRLGADNTQIDLDPALKPSGDLLRRPTFSEAVQHEAPQRFILLQNDLALAAVTIRPFGMDRPVRAVLMRVAS